MINKMAGLKDLYVRPDCKTINTTFIQIEDLVKSCVLKPYKSKEEIEGVKKLCKLYNREDLIKDLDLIIFDNDKDVEEV